MVTVGEVDRAYFRELSQSEFKAAWRTFLSLAPGLHPDEYEVQGSGWHENPVLEAIGAEAWERYENDELSDEEFYDAEAHRTLINDAVNKKQESRA